MKVKRYFFIYLVSLVGCENNRNDLVDIFEEYCGNSGLSVYEKIKLADEYFSPYSNMKDVFSRVPSAEYIYDDGYIFDSDLLNMNFNIKISYYSEKTDHKGISKRHSYVEDKAGNILAEVRSYYLLSGPLSNYSVSKECGVNRDSDNSLHPTTHSRILRSVFFK